MTERINTFTIVSDSEIKRSVSCIVSKQRTSIILNEEKQSHTHTHTHTLTDTYAYNYTYLK